jgi:hypothetical protein
MAGEAQVQKEPRKSRTKLARIVEVNEEGLVIPGGTISVETSPSLQAGKKVATKVHECLQGITEEFQQILASDSSSPKSGFPSGPPGFRLEEWSVTLHVDANGEVSWIPFFAKVGMSAGGSLTFTFKRDDRAVGSS